MMKPLSGYLSYAVGKCDDVSATQTCRDPGRNVTPLMRFPAVRGQRPELRARLTPRLTDAKPQRERSRQTHKQTAGNICCNIVIAAYKSGVREEETRGGFKGVCQNLPRIRGEVRFSQLCKVLGEVRMRRKKAYSVANNRTSTTE